MERRDDKMNPSTSFLMGNLVDGVINNEVDINDPIINFLKNEDWNDRGGSDWDSLESDDSDIEVLIEEHILLEKLKQVTGEKSVECVGSLNDSETEKDEENPVISSLGKSSIFELNLIKSRIEEAMTLNLKIRDELLAMEKRLLEKYNEACEKQKLLKTKEPKVATLTKSKLRSVALSDRFIDSFRAPYFKFNGSVPPWNADSEKLPNTNLLIISDEDDWRTSSITSLCQAIRKNIINEQTKNIISEQTELNRGGKRNKTSYSTKYTESYILQMQNAELYDLVKDRDDRSLNWKAIAACVTKPVTELECLRMWSLHLKPSLKAWASDEHSKMLKIAKAHKLQNWDKIAAELNTGRSGYECFFHHQNSFFLEWNDGKWSKEEEEHLSKVVENSKIGNFITWDKVTYFMDTKYVEQIYSKWYGFQAPHITRGPFTEQEDRILLGMIHKFGANLKDVATVLKNRSITQLTARYKNHLLPQLCLKVGEWTVEEDEKLLNLVEKHGESNWATIAKHFRTRSRVQIRHRHKLLKKKLDSNPNLNLRKLFRPKRPTSKKRIFQNRTFFNKVISTSGKHAKFLIKSTHKPNKRSKTVDMKLTQYYQAQFLTETITNDFLSIKPQVNNESNTSTSTVNLTEDKVIEEDANLFKLSPGKSITSFLLFSSVALRNLQEAAETDEWSQKERVGFHKGILDLYTANDEVQKDLFKWHKTFCSLFAAPALISHLDLDKWKNILSKEY